MSTLGKAVIEFSADTARFTGDVGRAAVVFEKNMAKMERGIENLRNVIAAAVSVGGLGALAKAAIDVGDQLDELAQKAGIAADRLSELRYSASIEGAWESIAVGLKELNKSLIEAGDRGSKAGQIFAALGVDLSSGTEVALKQVAQRFSEMEDGAQKSALAVELFGKAGTDMIPWLNRGADGIEQLTEQARALGLTMSKEQAAQFAQFNDQIKILGMLSQVVGVGIASVFVPAINSMTDNLIKAAEKGNLLWQTMMEIGKVIAALGGALSLKNSPLDRLAEGLFQADENMRRLREGASVWPGQAASTANKPTGQLNTDALSRALLRGGTAPAGTPEKDPRFGIDEVLRRQIEAAEDFRKALGEEQAAVQAITEARLKDAEAIKRQLDPTIELAEQTEKIADLVNRGLLTSEQGDQFLEQLTTKLIEAQGAFDTLKDKGKQDLDELKRAIEGWGRQFSRTMADMVVESQYSFDRIRDLFRDLLKDIVAAQIQKRFTDPIVKAGGGLLDTAIGALGGAFGGLFGGGGAAASPVPLSAAAGGPAFAGMPMLVGEHGPELMIPEVSGQIIPNGGFGSINIYPQYNLGSNVSRAEVQQQIQRGNAQLRQDIAQDLATNGPLRKQIKASG